MENLLVNSPSKESSVNKNNNSSSNSNGRLKHKGDVDKSMEEFLDELDEMSRDSSSKSPVHSGVGEGGNDESNTAAPNSSYVSSRRGYRSNSEKSEVIINTNKNS